MQQQRGRDTPDLFQRDTRHARNAPRCASARSAQISRETRARSAEETPLRRGGSKNGDRAAIKQLGRDKRENSLRAWRRNLFPFLSRRINWGKVVSGPDDDEKGYCDVQKERQS